MPRYRKSSCRRPERTLIEPTRIALETVERRLAHVLFDRLPDEKDLAAAERAEVMDTFQKDRVLQPFADGANVVFDALR